MTFEEIKFALRIEHDMDDMWLKPMHKAAQDYIKDAVSLSKDREPFFIGNEKFDVAVLFMLGHWYENRSDSSDKPNYNIDHGIANIIQQLRGGYYAFCSSEYTD